jgi:ABC-type lipoprotein release transport system permease subunit
MTFLGLIFRNIWRAKIRTTLTILGIALGVATITIFGLLTAGMVTAISSAFDQGLADFTVAKADAADIVLSFLDAEQIEIIQNTEGVARAASVMMSLTMFENNPYFLVYGIDQDGVEMFGFHVMEGRIHEDDNTTVMVTHDAHVASSADRIIRMADGVVES